MAIELLCGNCHGHLLVEIPGSVVACPHCGVHLQTAVAGSESAGGASSATAPVTNEEMTVVDSGPVAPRGKSDVPDFLEGPEFVDLDATRVDGGAVPPADDEAPAWLAADAEPPSAWQRADEPPPFLTGPLDASTPPLGFAPVVPAADAGIPANPVTAPPASAASASSGGLASAPATSSAPAPEPQRELIAAGGVENSAAGRVAASAAQPVAATMAAATPASSSLAFKILVSYASAVTVACLYLAWLLMSSPSRSPCLDLPDLKVHENKGNKVTTLIYVDPVTPVYRWHRLKLGETRNYGPVNITPLRVTRGPLDFAFFDTPEPIVAPEEKEEEEMKEPVDEGRPSTRPVLKLHLRIENVSDDLEFAPLDRALVFTKETDPKNPRRFKANNFICAADEKRKPENFIWMYDLPPNSLWTVKDQNLDRELKPHESVESFLPSTEERIDSLSGNYVWRVHFRRGYNRDSLNGVTSLIEVAFNTSEIVDDPPPAQPEPDAVEKVDGKS